MGREIVKDLDA